MVPNTAQGCVNSVPFEEEGRVCFWGHSPPQHTKHSETLLPDTLHSSWPHDFGTRDLNDLWVEQKPAESYTFPPHKCAISYLCRWSFAFHLHGFVRKSSLFGAKGGYFSLNQFSSNFFFPKPCNWNAKKKTPTHLSIINTHFCCQLPWNGAHTIYHNHVPYILYLKSKPQKFHSKAACDLNVTAGSLEAHSYADFKK